MSSNRVSEDRVARVLNLIAAPPNLRNHPQTGDIQGNYDAWFDGGAICYITGYTEYKFSDGTRAIVIVVPQLSVTIEFADGARVSVVQEKTGEGRTQG
ncbi:MAG: hypothetical protein ACE5HB_00095 [Terriglobia bacterium]